MTEVDDNALDLEGALAEMPVFPLPGTVFFPSTLLPLHIFEPRYRQMTEHVLATHNMLAVGLCDGDETVRGVLGLGRVVHHERLDDGRFHLLLQGVARVQIDEELPMGDLLFRRARAHVIDNISEPDDLVEQEVQAVRACYLQLLSAVPEAKDALGDLPRRISDPGTLADVLCASALADPEERQAALEEDRVSVRLRLATEALAGLILQRLPDDETSSH